MAPQLKLTYFDGTGRAELTRLALSYGKIQFEDERLDWTAFQALKPSLPLGQVPVLSVDGKTYSQSIAIARYAAKLSGLYPADALEALRVDMVIDTIQDLVAPHSDIKYREKDETKKAEKSKVFLEETVPKFFTALETMIGSEFFLNKISLADLVVFDFITNGVSVTFPDFKLDGYPKLVKLVSSVKAAPGIAEYLAKHQK